MRIEMEKLNLPPFYVSQKVVAIENSIGSGKTLITKGTEYTILNVTQYKCGCWGVVVDSAKRHFTTAVCYYHINVRIGGRFWSATMFAPLESTFQSITFAEVIKIESPLIGIN